ncbi:MAG: dihydroorotase [Bacteroidia bacterium]
MSTILIKNATIVNEGSSQQGDLLIKDGLIHTIGSNLQDAADETIDAQGMLLLPGAIDDQVHFREPGLTHKGEIATESRAAAAGGVTSFMEMPNTKPQALTQKLLADKYNRAAEVSAVNYSFFMGASNDNLEEVLKTDPRTVCGVKIFMGSSTGNMLVDDHAVLDKLFANVPMLIATHCEKEEIVRANMAAALEKYGDDIPISEHPLIRSEAACYASSSAAVSLAKKHNTRLHILHISTAKELDLFRNDIPITEKRITAEACIHHLWFSDEDYDRLGVRIKWNPAVKQASDREAIRAAVNDGRIDVIATDHAPHTKEEKSNLYPSCPSGGPLVQHSIVAMLELVEQGVFSLEKVVEKMSHHPAMLFRVEKRGFIREGYWADLVLVEKNPWTVAPENIHYKCGWSPLEGTTLQNRIHSTFVNGQRVYSQGAFDDDVRGQRLLFETSV